MRISDKRTAPADGNRFGRDDRISQDSVKSSRRLAEPQIDPEDADFIAQAMTLLPAGPFTDATWGEWTAAVKEATGRKGKGLFMPLRKAVTGQAHGPDMSDVMPLLQVVKARP